MNTPPTLETKRLKLRPFTEDDVAELVPLIGTREVAATTLRIPIPIPRMKHASSLPESITMTKSGLPSLFATGKVCVEALD